MPDTAHSEIVAELEPSAPELADSPDQRMRERQLQLLLALAVIAVGACLYLARDVFMPITLAVLLAVVLSPLVRALRKIGIIEPVGAAFVLLLLFGGLGYVAYTMWAPASDWVHELPQHVGEAHTRLSGLLTPLHDVQAAGQSVSTLAEPGEKPAVMVVQPASGGTSLVFLHTQQALIGFGATIVLTYFLLTSGDLFLRKFVALLPRFRDKKTAVEIAQQIQADMSAYLFTITLINCGLGGMVGLVLWALGVPTPVLWGTMVTLFNYVPYLGPITSFGVIGLVSALTFDSVWRIALPPFCFLCITLLEGNFLTPAILARRLTLNTVAVFVSLLFWGWMWGIPGTFMAVPLLAVFKILCDRIAPLKNIGDFLGR